MSMSLAKLTTNELLYVGFNQDQGCFSVGTDKGFRIYHCEPFKETFKRDFSSGGIGIVEMLFRCNILALVGGGASPRFPPHKVMIWDDHQNRCIGELAFRSDVRAVKLRRDRVVVALANKVYVYNFADLCLLDHIETFDNPKGLLVVCPAPHNNVVACPGLSKGHVRVELYDQRKTTLIAAHEASLSCIALNATGTRLATASEKGTLIRVYDTATGDLLQELRRGADKAEIYSVAFNMTATMLACTSDKGTVHIFKLKDAVHDFSSPTPTPAPAAPAAAAAAAPGKAASGSARSPSASSAGAAAGAGGGSADGDNAAALGRSSSGGVGATGAAEGVGGDPAAASHADAGIVTGGPAAAAGATTGVAGAPGSLAHALALATASTPTTLPAPAANPKSSFAFMRGILPKYFSSEWSFAQFRVPDTRALVAFGQEPSTIIVVGADGSFFKANYDKGGEAVRVAYSHFVAPAGGLAE